MKKKNASTVKAKKVRTPDALLEEAIALLDAAKKLNEAVRITSIINRPRAPSVHIPSLEKPLTSSSFKFFK